MSETTGIQWADSTGGPFLVCTEVSPGCANCYSRELTQTRLAPIIRKAYRRAGFKDWETRPVWGKTAPRVLSKGFWTDALRINRKPWRCDDCGAAYPSKPDYCTAFCPPSSVANQCKSERFHRARM